ncbi:MAG: type 4a pilus biogenesis protein PilO [Gammaproteobacteria bacterium]
MNINLKKIYLQPLRVRIIFFLLIFIFVFYLGYRWHLASLVKVLSNAKQQEVELKQQYEMVIAKESILKQELADFPMLQRTLTQWKEKLITYSELPELINDILKLGANNHLNFSHFNPEEEKRADYQAAIYYKTPIKMIAVGSYHQLADFVSQVANLPNVVVIGDFSISNENTNDMLGEKLAAQANAENLLTADITFEVYYLREKVNHGK